jgi:hypothetical protein
MRYTSARSRERARRRNRALLRVGKWAALVAILLGIGYWSYATGLWLAERKVVNLNEELARARRSLEESERDRADLRGRLANANQEIATLQSRYKSDVPTGTAAELLALARERLAAGVGAERIADVLRAAQNLTPCEGRLQTRRFAPRTGPQPSPEDTTSFMDGLITLQASMPSNPEDPNKPVSVTFTRLGGAPVTVAGRLPLRHSVIVDNHELRFTVAASDLRGYLVASVNLCTR